MKNLNNEKGSSLVIGIISVVILTIIAIVTSSVNNEPVQNLGSTNNEMIQNQDENKETTENLKNENNDENNNENIQENDTQTHEHEYTIYLTSTQSTCTTKGKEKRKCKYCNDVQTTDLPIDSNNHPGETKVEYANINNTHHSKNTVCTSCGANIVEEKEIHNHKLEEKVSEATCTQKARNKYICNICEQSVTLEEGETLPHTWDDGVVTKKATENESGIKTYTCTVCSETKTETIYYEEV